MVEVKIGWFCPSEANFSAMLIGFLISSLLIQFVHFIWSLLPRRLLLAWRVVALALLCDNLQAYYGWPPAVIYCLVHFCAPRLTDTLVAGLTILNSQGCFVSFQTRESMATRIAGYLT